jgi:hypothetical protein
MDEIETTINEAFKAQVTIMYNQLSQSLLAAKDDVDKISAAKEKFRKGLDYADGVRKIAKEVAGL